jgi:hypothetical protein
MGSAERGKTETAANLVPDITPMSYDNGCKINFNWAMRTLTPSPAALGMGQDVIPSVMPPHPVQTMSSPRMIEAANLWVLLNFVKTFPT